MAYVDLNPIRAGMDETPHKSDFTALQDRLFAYEKQTPQQSSAFRENPISSPLYLMPFKNQTQASPQHKSLPFIIEDYFELIDWTGRMLRHPNKGFIPQNAPTILQQVTLNHTQWVQSMKHFGSDFKLIVGPLIQLKILAKKYRKKWWQGQKRSEKLYTVSSI